MNEEQKEAEEKKPESPTDGKSNQQKVVYLIGAIILAILIALGIWQFSKSTQKESPSPTPIAEASPSPEASASPSPTPPSTTKVSPKPSPKVSPPSTPTPSPSPSPTPVTFSVTGVTAAVSPTSYTGPCPKKFEFTANITANAAGSVTYKWARSDGAGAPTHTLVFAAAGTQAATPNDWTLSSPGTKWEKIQILTPNTFESNQAEFTLTCS